MVNLVVMVVIMVVRDDNEGMVRGREKSIIIAEVYMYMYMYVRDCTCNQYTVIMSKMPMVKERMICAE